MLRSIAAIVLGAIIVAVTKPSELSWKETFVKVLGAALTLLMSASLYYLFTTLNFL